MILAPTTWSESFTIPVPEVSDDLSIFNDVIEGVVEKKTIYDEACFYDAYIFRINHVFKGGYKAGDKVVIGINGNFGGVTPGETQILFLKKLNEQFYRLCHKLDEAPREVIRADRSFGSMFAGIYRIEQGLSKNYTLHRCGTRSVLFESFERNISRPILSKSRCESIWGSYEVLYDNISNALNASLPSGQ